MKSLHEFAQLVINCIIDLNNQYIISTYSIAVIQLYNKYLLENTNLQL